MSPKDEKKADVQPTEVIEKVGQRIKVEKQSEHYHIHDEEYDIDAIVYADGSLDLIPTEGVVEDCEEEDYFCFKHSDSDTVRGVASLMLIAVRLAEEVKEINHVE